MKLKSTSIELFTEFFNNLKKSGLNLPEFISTKEIIIFSDYSGERKEDRYNSYSFYLLDKSSALNACWDILKLREAEPEWKDNSFIEYKKLTKDKVRRRILPSFLRIFDQFEGIVITVLIEKKSPNYFMRVSDQDVRFIESRGLGSWTPDILRKSSNVLSILAFLIKRFLDDDKFFTWYSDRDDIFGADQLKRNNTLNLFSQFLRIYEAKIKGERFNYISDKHTLLDSDFLAIADLSAGAVLDYYQTTFSGGEIKDSTKQIIGWMSLNDTPLKKLMIVGKEEGGDKKLISIRNY